VTTIAETCWWLREALSHDEFRGEPTSPVASDVTTDVVVVGGGFTGLWTAWHLKALDPGVDVVVLERDECGFGPSGRNGGFLNGFYERAGALTEMYGPDGARAVLAAGDDAVAGVRRWLEDQRVDAWFRPAPSVGVASSRAQVGAWDEQVASARALGVEDRFSVLDRDALARICSSPAFEGGVAVHDGGGTLQPARLVRALRQACLDAGVRIHEGTPVTPPHPGTVGRVETLGGVVRARSVVLGANAWMAAWPGFRRRIVARATYIAITAAAPDRLADIGWTDGTGIYDLRSSLRYLRTTPDGRIALGVGGQRGSWTGRLDHRFDTDEVGVAHAVRAIRQFFPGFRGVPIEAGWGGPIDVSSSHEPYVGTLPHGRTHFALGYTGNGVGPTHLMGRILAARALGVENADTALPLVGAEPRPWPPQPFRGAGASIVNAAVVRRDDALDAGRRPDAATRFVAGLPDRFGYHLG
jgi:glycine/D-amino acid oxidase-like deaminating enzyme